MRALRFGVIATLALTVQLLAVPASAQTRTRPPNPATVDQGVGIGAVGGWTRSNVTGSAEDEAFLEPRNDFMFGVWFGGNRNGRVGVMGEVDFVTKGTKEKDFEGKLRLTYLEFPVLARLNLGSRTREGTLFYAVGGPAFGWKLKAKIQDPEGDLDVSDDYATFDFGLMAGAGVEIKRFGFEFRANWGLRQLFEPFEGETANKNFQLQILGKYRFN